MSSPRSPTSPMSPPAQEETTVQLFGYADFLALYQGEDPLKHFPPILNLLREEKFQEVEAALLIHLDNFDGVKTSLVSNPDKKIYPTGVALVRDATAALPCDIDKRLSPNDNRILADNLLLRSLEIIRALLHLFTVSDVKKTYRDNLLKAYEDLFKKIRDDVPESKSPNLGKLEQEFNTMVIRILHQTGLDEGLGKTEKVYEQLLIHYRDLACTLSPAKSLVTLLKDKRGEVTIRMREQADPITVKTATQLNQLKQTLTESKEENFHTQQPEAYRMATEAFKELIMRQDRYLPALTREHIAPTVKNGYVVTNTVRFGDEPKEEKFSFLRCAALVYVGDGETEAKIAQYTEENLKQLKETAEQSMGEGKIQIISLLTDTQLSNPEQHTIIEYTQAAATKQKQDIGFSRIATNVQGTTQGVVLDKSLAEDKNITSLFSLSGNFGDSARKVDKASLLARGIIQFRQEKPLISCADGKDRTGTAAEKTAIDWLEKLYKDRGIAIPPGVGYIVHVEKVRAKGIHNAFLATLATPGSLGMKSKSRPRKWFGLGPDSLFQPDTGHFFFRDSAKTSKEAKLNEEQLYLILNSDADEEPFIHYEELLDQIRGNTIDIEPFKEKFTAWIDFLLLQNARETKRTGGFFNPKYQGTLATLKEQSRLATKLEDIKNILGNVNQAILPVAIASQFNKMVRLLSTNRPNSPGPITIVDNYFKHSK